MTYTPNRSTTSRPTTRSTTSSRAASIARGSPRSPISSHSSTSSEAKIDALVEWAQTQQSLNPPEDQASTHKKLPIVWDLQGDAAPRSSPAVPPPRQFYQNAGGKVAAPTAVSIFKKTIHIPALPAKSAALPPLVVNRGGAVSVTFDGDDIAEDERSVVSSAPGQLTVRRIIGARDAAGLRVTVLGTPTPPPVIPDEPQPTLTLRTLHNCKVKLEVKEEPESCPSTPSTATPPPPHDHELITPYCEDDDEDLYGDSATTDSIPTAVGPSTGQLSDSSTYSVPVTDPDVEAVVYGMLGRIVAAELIQSFEGVKSSTLSSLSSHPSLPPISSLSHIRGVDRGDEQDSRFGTRLLEREMDKSTSTSSAHPEAASTTSQ